MRMLAVTACPTGIAHTYMAADIIRNAANKHDIKIKIETQGALGIESEFTEVDIHRADLVLIASDIEIVQVERFAGKKVIKASIEDVLIDVDAIVRRCERYNV